MGALHAVFLLAKLLFLFVFFLRANGGHCLQKGVNGFNLLGGEFFNYIFTVTVVYNDLF
jgi:hypothetical protein